MFLQALRRPQNRMPQGFQDVETATDLGMMRRLEAGGNAEVDGDRFTHSTEQEAAEENYFSEASWDSTSTSLGLTSFIDSGSDDSEAEQEVLAETDFGPAPEEMQSPHISKVRNEQ